MSKSGIDEETFSANEDVVSEDYDQSEDRKGTIRQSLFGHMQ